MKRPAFQFYPADWRKDAALQSCSLAAQGLWVNMLCIAHECEPYGHLTINGRAMSDAQIARLVGVAGKECERLLAELLDAGVVSRTDEGVLYSRRMVRDEDLRNRRAEGGKAGSEHGAKGAEHGIKGGRPPKARGVSEPPLEPPPSSSSSSSEEYISQPSVAHPHAGGMAAGFDEFWQAWPPGERKQDKAKCLAHWRRNGLHALAEPILADIRLKRGTQKWAEGFIEAPLVYLRGKRWEDGVLPEAPRQAAAALTVPRDPAADAAAAARRAEDEAAAVRARSPEAQAARLAAVGKVRPLLKAAAA